ncbi:hypothetical protein [Lachnoclostridium sp.]|uniref:hypothetical protein n=1 Tax=Lachnoclostridium sp. TaxID=2028282 RepID=UPI0028A275E2|nr:hypothetical protein [Lachnoclostridium sp.]
MINTKKITYDIIDRTILEPENATTFAVMGDNVSHKMIFRIARFIDSVDLSQKLIYVCYKNSIGATGESPATISRLTNTILEIDWKIPNELTSTHGDVEFYLEFRKLDDQNNKIYVLKTKPVTRQIEKSFMVENTATEADFSFEKAFLDDNSSHLTRSDLVDSELPFRVVDRDIIINSSRVIAILNDNMSQILSFRLKRVVDGIDRADKTFCFKYINANGESDIAIATNINNFEDDIIISWALDRKVTRYAGTITFSICILGNLSDGTFYSWNTKPSTFEVETGLDIESQLVTPVNSWFDSWVIEADNILKQSSQFANQAKEFFQKAELAKKDIEELVNATKDHAIAAGTSAKEAKETIYEIVGLYVTRSDKDIDNSEIFKKVNYYRPDRTLYMSSTLSTARDKFDQRIEVKYDIDGTSVVSTDTYSILRDEDDSVTGHFSSLNQLQYHGLV